MVRRRDCTNSSLTDDGAMVEAFSTTNGSVVM
jgi:hypothetical protein